MARQVFRHDSPDRFVAGTVGEPGERVFYLQARSGAALTSVVCEKGQVHELAERLDELLDRVRAEVPDANVPDRGDVTAIDLDPLEAPVVADFRVITLALGWDQRSAQVVIEARGAEATLADVDDDAGDEDDDEGDAGTDTLHVRLTPPAARAFAERSRRVVSAGRPPCPFCLQPRDPAGHVCPRANGYRR
ncbi:MAG: DUF3090 family protein [Actinomycetales bacterium]|nr:DUF3090 family protein [Actinomycetales bacterium]